MKRFVIALIACTGLYAGAAEHKGYADVLLRYENEVSHRNLADRERIRLVVWAGVNSQFENSWSTHLRLRTGLKNKQNVPAITLHKFNDQPQPDTDVFIDRVFAKKRFNDGYLTFGKIPWQTKQVTDVFWDRDLNPIGVHIDYKFNQQHGIQAAHFLPLDGASDTIGAMSVLQWHSTFQFEELTWTVSPWWVNYSGDNGAEFAKKDTQLDNQFIRLSSKISWKKFQLGVDLGHSLESFNQADLAQFKDEKTSYAVELKYGSLKKPGQYLAHLRYLHVERFGVVTEFAQNATSRFSTSNIKGWDFRLRRKMTSDWWVGTRISDTQNLVGDQPEEGLRFRLETKFSF